MLEQLAGSNTDGRVYICDDGSEYQSGNYDLTYYLNHTGYYTPDGRKLVRVKRPNCYIDPLSESLYQLEDEILEAAITTVDGEVLFESRFKPAYTK